MKYKRQNRSEAFRLFAKYLLYGTLMTAAGIILEIVIMEDASYRWRMVFLTLILLEGILFFCFFSFGYRHIYLVYSQIEYTLKDAEDITEGIGSENSVEQLCRAVIRMDGLASKKKAQEVLIKQAELDALQNQINPHFLYNTLECIRGKALKEGVEQIANMTEALSAFFRYSINIQENMVPLRRELENARNYFLIQKYRFGNRFSLDVHCEDTACIDNCMIPKMTLQPIVENAIFHGLEKSVFEGKIVIRVTETEKRLILTVQDDGIGMSDGTLKKVRESLNGRKEGEERKHTGIALSNINERIHLHFGYKYGLYVNSEEGLGTEVLITLPKVESEAVKGEQEAFL